MQYQYIIKSTVENNSGLLKALNLDAEDVEQELSIGMLSAIDEHAPDHTDMQEYLQSVLSNEVIRIGSRFQPYGMTDVHKPLDVEFVPYESLRNYDCSNQSIKIGRSLIA